MNQTQIESMRLALGALEGLINRTSAQSIYSFMETERRIAISACVGLREALAEQPAQIAGFDVVLDDSMPPNTIKFVQPAPATELREQEPVPIDWGAVHEKLCEVWQRESSADEGLDEIQDLVVAATPPAQQQEPVAWIDPKHLEWLAQSPDNLTGAGLAARQRFADMVPLYTAPPASKPWVGLTDEEIAVLDVRYHRDNWKLIKEAEDKLREKNA